MIKKLAKRFSKKVFLIPYEETPILSIQEAKQRAGWSITAFDLPDVWKLTGGEGVTIGVLDTGCEITHPDLKDNLLPGRNFTSRNANDVIDRVGHGTHTTGIICAENNDLGMVGVAPKSKVVPIKVLGDNGEGNIPAVVNGIRYATSIKVDLICMSLGSPKPMSAIRSAIIAASQQGIACFVAAGNAGQTKEVFYPANDPETIAIGAIDENLKRANFSNTGQNLDFMCPGVDVLSTVPGNWYSLMSGTSMAAPFACGVAALLLSYSRKPNSKIKITKVNDYREIFRRYTIPLANGHKEKFFQGFGIIDPRKLLTELAH